MIAELKKLWQEAFGDSDETLNAFFAHGFSEDRFLCIQEDGVPVCALYWFDCYLQGHKLAYIYALATAKSHRGKGLAHRLMAQTHTRLKEQGYAGALLVPGSSELFGFYEKMGYRAATTVTEFSCDWAARSVPVLELTSREYARLRRAFLPRGGVLQEGATISYLQAQMHFYAGKDFLLCATMQEDTLLAQELLGDPRSAPHILRALGAPKGTFRTVGTDKAFSMFLPFREDCPAPAYFGLALD
ncbi:MAG: GNAT family N-acetyltransferase [Oscillospiraceae bacterium]|nr:GNAT family N-acetyltransferase [Oscillospiraceae bacterium]